MQYCSLQHRTLLLSPVTSTLFLLWLHPFILSGIISLLISCSIFSTYQLREFIFQYPIILPFHTVHVVLKATTLKWLAISFSSGPHSQTSPPWPVRLGWPHMAWLSFIELDKAVVHVIRLASFQLLWFQCVCPLMPSRNTYHLTWVCLTLEVGYLFMAVPAKCSRCCLPWMRDKKGKTTDWERLEISSRKLEIPKEHFMQRWAR